VVNYWFIKGDFLHERSRRIGASDIPALIPNPEKPTESLAGYGRTAGYCMAREDRPPRARACRTAGGNGSLPGTEIFRDFYSHVCRSQILGRLCYPKPQLRYDGADESKCRCPSFPRRRIPSSCAILPRRNDSAPRRAYDPSTAFYTPSKKTAHGIAVSFDKPFLVEAKSASYWSAKRPEGSIVKGYDPQLKTWQGIPLAHYMQIQFQLALFEIDTAYLSLLHNTNQYDVWKINANRKHQGRLIDLAGAMVRRIETDTPPADMAMNAQDIMDLYPNVGDDFVILNGEERDKAVEIAREYVQADKQEKRWKAKKEDAKDAMAVMLKDRPELRDGDGIIAKWRNTGGGERIKALSEIKADDLVTYRYLKRKQLINEAKVGRTVNVSWKGDEE
jgi:hypothetical protein